MHQALQQTQQFTVE